MNPKNDEVRPELAAQWQQLAAVEGRSRRGFSDRLNFLVDCSDLGAPRLREGRIQWFAELTGRARNTVAEWLSRDSPPVREMQALVGLLAGHLEGGIAPERIECWLLFGDRLIANPVSATSYEGRRQAVELALWIMAEVSRANGIPPDAYDFHQALDQTVRLVENFQLQHAGEVQAGHLDIVRLYMARKSDPLESQIN